MATKIRKSDTEWREQLAPEQYAILREKATERPFSGAHLDERAAGTYRCAGCGAELFESQAKFESGSGWPSFNAPAQEEAIARERDDTLGMVRTEALCSSCGGHLGHVFDDGPGPQGARYCINSGALDFDAE